MDMPAITPLQPAAATPATAAETGSTAAPFEEVLAAELDETKSAAEEAEAAPSAENTPAENADPAVTADSAVTETMLAALAPATPPSLAVPASTAADGSLDSADPVEEVGLRPLAAAPSPAGPSFRPPDRSAGDPSGEGSNLPPREVPPESTVVIAETAAISPANAQATAPSAPQTAGTLSPAVQPASAAWVAPAVSQGGHSTPVLEVAVPVQHRDWASKFSERVTLTVNEGLQSAELRVNPEELGPVRIRVSLDRNEASLVFAAAHPLVRAAIEEALPALRESMQQAGLQLGEALVAGGQPQGGQAQGNNHSDLPRAEKPGETLAVVAENVRQISSSLLVDTYA